MGYGMFEWMREGDLRDEYCVEEAMKSHTSERLVRLRVVVYSQLLQ
jgi:hypothetical protein